MSSATAQPEPTAAADPLPGEDRILTLPNAISVVRLSCLPVFLWLLFGRDNRAAAAALLGILGATDFVDGYIARHWNQVSTVGKVLDPVADRLLFFVGGLAIVVDGSIPPWVAWLVLGRELAVSVATVGLAALGGTRVDVTWWGKAGTFCNMVAIPMFLAAESTVGWRETASVVAWGFTAPGLVLSYVALGLYVPLGLQALRAGRAGRAAEAAAESDGAEGTAAGGAARAPASGRSGAR
ncbi:MAG TPA: CDP-alcohol phosphatidyltransferase family protein [Acidimicrobiales bacterium]|nr:CDP-alcohol phosphatidyltransferase family protein [Acidimicrobiales bacterium]